MISSGRISVFIGMLPAMKITDPYSPTPRAKAKAKPVSQAGSKCRHQDMAENLQGFRTQARRRFLHFTRDIRQYWLYGTYHEWKRYKSQRQGDAQGGVGDLETQVGRELPDQPVGVYSAVSAIPATAVGNANGRSIIASMIFRPGKV